MISHFRIWAYPALLLVSIGLAAGDPMNVSDTNGRDISIDLLQVDGNKVTFSVKGKKGEFELNLDRFDEASQKSILEAAKTLKPRYPELDIDVVIGKRRDKGTSSYMVTQEVSSKVQIENTSLKLPMPKTTARIIFIGRGRKTGDFYKVLAAEEFQVSIKPGKDFEFEPKGFVTRYDSDNRGTGNIGGYQYDSYILALLDEDGRVINHKTSDPSIRALIENHTIMVSKVVAFPVNTLLNEAMSVAEPPKTGIGL